MPEDGIDEDKRTTLRRFAALGAATPLAGLAGTSEAATPETRTAILGYLSTVPGAHFSKLRDDLGLGTGEAQYHLRQLLDDGAVEASRDGDYRRFFPADRFGQFEQTALGYLRRRTPRGMLIELLRHPDTTGRALADRLEVSPPTISTYAAEMADAGLLDRTDGYAVERPETVLLLIVRYADSLGPRATALAADAGGLIEVSR